MAVRARRPGHLPVAVSLPRGALDGRLKSTRAKWHNGRSAPVLLTRGGMQGNKLSHQLLDILFFALLLVLRAAGVSFQLVTDLRIHARRFADDLTLICHSAEGMSGLIQVVAEFC